MQFLDVLCLSHFDSSSDRVDRVMASNEVKGMGKALKGGKGKPPGAPTDIGLFQKGTGKGKVWKGKGKAIGAEGMAKGSGQGEGKGASVEKSNKAETQETPVERQPLDPKAAATHTDGNGTPVTGARSPEAPAPPTLPRIPRSRARARPLGKASRWRLIFLCSLWPLLSPPLGRD